MTDQKRVSMADAERKSLTIAKIVMAAATLLLFSMSYFGLFNTYLYMWHLKTGWLAGLFGIVFYAIALLTLVFESRISNAATNETLWYLIWIIGLVGGIVVSCGFNFSL